MMDVYTPTELRAKIASNEYGAELCLQHAMINIFIMENQIEVLRNVLRQVAQVNAWREFGECRSFGADVPLLSAHDAYAVAKVALGEYRDGPP